jgi:hypothetical protein
MCAEMPAGQTAHYCCQILIKIRILECRQISANANIRFHENSFNCSRASVCGQMARQTDIENLIGSFMQLFVVNVPESATTIKPTEYFEAF